MLFGLKKKEKVTQSGVTKKQAKDLAKLSKKLGSNRNIKRINKEH